MSQALDELLAGVDMAPMRKEVTLQKGNKFVFWHTPLTLDEQDYARKTAKRDDTTDYVLTLLVEKARDSNGRKRFDRSDLPKLKRMIPKNLAEALLEKLLTDEADPEDGTFQIDLDDVVDDAPDFSPKQSRRPSKAIEAG